MMEEKKTMDNKLFKRTIAALIINAVVIVLEIVGLVYSIIEHGGGIFQFYTIDSNILSMVACTAYSVYLIKKLKGKGEVPQWARVLRYTAACCLTITFLVVMCGLLPTAKDIAAVKYYLIRGAMPYYHIICPLAVVISFLVLDNEPKLDKKTIHIAMIPTELYAVITVILNLARVLDGPYFFLQVYKQAWYMSVLWFIGIIGAAYLICWLMWLFNKMIAERQIKE